MRDDREPFLHGDGKPAVNEAPYALPAKTWRHTPNESSASLAGSPGGTTRRSDAVEHQHGMGADGLFLVVSRFDDRPISERFLRRGDFYAFNSLGNDLRNHMAGRVGRNRVESMDRSVDSGSGQHRGVRIRGRKPSRPVLSTHRLFVVSAWLGWSCWRRRQVPLRKPLRIG